MRLALPPLRTKDKVRFGPASAGPKPARRTRALPGNHCPAQPDSTRARAGIAD